MTEQGASFIFFFVGLAIGVVIGFVIGSTSVRSDYKRDTYDCTVKCPNMAHSIEVDQICFCEVK